MGRSVASAALTRHQREAAEDWELERQWDECVEGLLSSIGGRAAATTEDSFSPLHAPGRVGSAGGPVVMPAAVKNEEASPPVGQFYFSPSEGGLSPTRESVEHIEKWLCSLTDVAAAGGYRVCLRSEHAELQQRAQVECWASEELQARLSMEMQDFREQCNEQCQTVELLAGRLTEAKAAMNTELEDLTMVQEDLACELRYEETRGLIAEERGQAEEMQFKDDMQAVEEECSAAASVCTSLRIQLQASGFVQSELREEIAARVERGAELRAAGRRDVEELSELWQCQVPPPELVFGTDEEADDRVSDASLGLECLEATSRQHCREELELAEQVEAAKDEQRELRARARPEVAAWAQEIDRLRSKLTLVDEEQEAAEETSRRHEMALGACGIERAILEEEFEACEARSEGRRLELNVLRDLADRLRSELHDVHKGIDRCRSHDEADTLHQEREVVTRDIPYETSRQRELREEPESDKKSWSLFCMRPRNLPVSPPASPRSTASRGSGSAPTVKTPLRKAGQARGAAECSSTSSTSTRRMMANEYPIGCVVRTVETAMMRRGELVQSDRVQEIPRGRRCEVLQHGAGRRLRVRDFMTEQVGWISSETQAGQQIIARISQECRNHDPPPSATMSPPAVGPGTRTEDRFKMDFTEASAKGSVQTDMV